MSKNIGEWSEVYVFFSILGDPHLYPCDAKLNRIPNSSLPVSEIIHGVPESAALRCIAHTSENGDVTWDLVKNETCLGECKDSAASEAAELLLGYLLSGKASTKSDGNPILKKTEDFLYDTLHADRVKATPGEKRDIALTVYDPRAGGEVTSGFSIKSFVGTPPSLLNSSGKTVFRYRIDNLSRTYVDELNKASIGKIIKKIEKLGAVLVWDSMDETFRTNLMYIDLSMPRLVAELVLNRYRTCGKDAEGAERTMEEETISLAKRDPLKLKNANLYLYKVKKLLEASALGMVPGKEWKGIEDANGGFIVVKEQGEIVTFHIYHRQVLMDYLIRNTKFDTPSTHKTRAKAGPYEQSGKIFENVDGCLYIDLPAQIRYIKR